MRTEGVVLAAPPIGRALGLSHRGEKLGIEELISEQQCRTAEGRLIRTSLGCAAELAPTLGRVAEEFWTVITAAHDCQHRYHQQIPGQKPKPATCVPGVV